MHHWLRLSTLVVLFVTLPFAVLPTKAADRPDWQKNIDWAIADDGAPDCADWPAYQTYPACLAVDTPLNRACLMRKAISSAKANDYDNVKWLVLTTQCHNADAYRTIEAQSTSTIIAYLKTK